MALSRREAQQRNFNIYQLRGILPRLVSLIPKDVKDATGRSELFYSLLASDMQLILDGIEKVKKTTEICLSCKLKLDGKPFRGDFAPTGHMCAECGETYSSELNPIYTISKKRLQSIKGQL